MVHIKLTKKSDNFFYVVQIEDNAPYAEAGPIADPILANKILIEAHEAATEAASKVIKKHGIGIQVALKRFNRNDEEVERLTGISAALLKREA